MLNTRPKPVIEADLPRAKRFAGHVPSRRYWPVHLYFNPAIHTGSALHQRIAEELRYAVRSLGRSPLFTVVAVLSLALALAVNTTVFALADGVLNPRVTLRESERLFEARMNAGDLRIAAPLDARHDALRTGRDGIPSPASFPSGCAVAAAGLRAERACAAAVSPEFFTIFGAQAEEGRLLGSGDATAVGDPAI